MIYKRGEQGLDFCVLMSGKEMRRGKEGGREGGREGEIERGGRKKVSEREDGESGRVPSFSAFWLTFRLPDHDRDSSAKVR